MLIHTLGIRLFWFDNIRSVKLNFYDLTLIIILKSIDKLKLGMTHEWHLSWILISSQFIHLLMKVWNTGTKENIIWSFCYDVPKAKKSYVRSFCHVFVSLCETPPIRYEIPKPFMIYVYEQNELNRFGMRSQITVIWPIIFCVRTHRKISGYFCWKIDFFFISTRHWYKAKILEIKSIL